MTYTDAQLRVHLSSFGIPSFLWQIADVKIATVSDDYIPEVWAAWVDSLRKNAPSLLTTLDIGGGKSRTVPRWIEEAGDCDNAACLCFAHAQMGNWLLSARGGPKVSRAYGFAFYTAEPRAANRNRAGGHAVMWWVNHEGLFRTFEPGDGEVQPWLPSEYMSARFGLCL